MLRLKYLSKSHHRSFSFLLGNCLQWNLCSFKCKLALNLSGTRRTGSGFLGDTDLVRAEGDFFSKVNNRDASHRRQTSSRPMCESGIHSSEAIQVQTINTRFPVKRHNRQEENRLPAWHPVSTHSNRQMALSTPLLIPPSTCISASASPADPFRHLSFLKLLRDKDTWMKSNCIEMPQSVYIFSEGEATVGWPGVNSISAPQQRPALNVHASQMESEGRSCPSAFQRRTSP